MPRPKVRSRHFLRLPTPRSGAKRLERRDRLATKTIQFAHRHDHVALEMGLELAQFERSSSETTKLFAQSIRGKRLAFGDDERNGTLDFYHMSLGIARDERQWRASGAMYFE